MPASKRRATQYPFRQAAAAALFFACALVSCATPYQERSLLGGFTESQLGPNVWRVTFLGNGMRTVDEVRDMVLLRSAELVRDAGYSHFAVRQSQDQSSSVGLGVGTVSGGVFLSMFQPIKHPEISAIVEARNQPGTGNDFVYDADYLLKSLGSKYRQK